MSPEEELRLLKEIEEASAIQGKTIMAWVENNLAYFNDEEVSKYFSRQLDFQIVENRICFNPEELAKLLPNKRVISFI